MADPRTGAEGAALVDDEALATARTLYYTVQFERDPATPEAVDWAIAQVIEGDDDRAAILDDLGRALGSDEDLAALLRADAHGDAQIRAFLRGVAERIGSASPGAGR